MGRRKVETGDPPAQKTAFEDMTQEQLIELAVEKGVTLEADMEREEIIQALIEADPSLSESDKSDDDDDDGLDDDDSDKDESEIQETGDDVKVGTIRTIQGVEMVKINESADGWVPAIRENIEAGKPVTVVCQKRAGKTIFAKTGRVITLDSNGRATVSAADGYYLGNIIINGKPEYTVE
jgi:hypothetical protein